MNHPLEGAFAKIAHADHHLQKLKAEIDASDYRDTIGFAQHFNPDTSIIEVTLQGVPDLPVLWSLMAADCVQNLRCALNYLAWELSRWNLARQNVTREPQPVTQFPINTWADKFDAFRLPDVHPDHVDRIRAIQPNGVDHLSQLDEDWLRNLPVEVLAKRHVLGVLVDLTNEDKHRILPTVVVDTVRADINDYSVIADCEVVSTNVFLQRSLQNGAKWSEITVRATGPKPEVQVNDEIEPAISFGAYRIGVLERVVEGVRHMVSSFESVF